MTEENATIALLLDEVIPRRLDDGDWRRVVKDAAAPRRTRGRRRPYPLQWRLGLAMTVVAVAIIAPLSALAVANDWWFLGAPSAPAPAGDIVVLESGSWNNVPWVLTAYRSQTGGVCVSFTPNPPDGRTTDASSGHTAAMGCTADLPGLSPSPGAHTHAIGFIGSSSLPSVPSPFPDFVAGPTADNVASVKVELASGKQLEIDTFAAPRSLGLSLRFYVAAVPSGDTVRAIVATDHDGNVLDQLAVPQPPSTSQTNGSTTPNSSTGGVEWGG
jgi:hypothetical protein